MIERQTELKRRYHRKKKMAKLKNKLKASSGEARTAILLKIKRLSPTWTEASLTQTQNQAASTTPKAEVNKEPKKKPTTGPRPKTDKK
ncbi:MAG: DUF6800 family protein [Fimbriiglobus sp.]